MLKRSHRLLTLACIYVIALGVRLIPALSTGLPYNYDCWEALSRVVAILGRGSFDSVPPHGPLFYELIALICLILGFPPIDVFTYAMPFISSTIIFPIYLLTNRLIKNSRAGFYGALMAAVSGIFVHQTSYTIPEALALTYASLAIYLLYEVMFKSDLRRLSLLFLSFSTVLLTHHLTTFLLVLALSFLSLIVPMSVKRFSFKMYTPILLLLVFFITAALWWAFAIPVTTIGFIFLILKSAPLAGIYGLPLILFSFLLFYALVFKWRAKSAEHQKSLLQQSIKISVISVVTLSLLTYVVVPSLSPYTISLEYLIYYMVPYTAFVLFPGVVGVSTFFRKNRNPLKRSFSTVWGFAPLAAAMFLVWASYWFILIYRLVPFMFLGTFPLVALGLSILMKVGSVKWRPIQGFALAYVVLLLVFMAYPPPHLLFSHNESYYRPELYAANWAGAYFKKPTVIDSDHRMGVLLRFTTGQFVWLGNETSWIGTISRTGSLPIIDPSLKYLVITDSMSKFGVVGGWTRPPALLPFEAILYLNSLPGVDRIYSSGVVTVYKTPH